MYAVIETGGKQYKVEKGDEIEVEFLDKKAKDIVNIDHILLVTKGKKLLIGQPYVKEAKVVCEVLENKKSKKIKVFKYRRRKSSKRQKGHRQKLTRLKIKDIEVNED